MEAKLAKWLDRATSWNGIVLIDEADIYLERREKEDLSRNSLVTGKNNTALGLPSLITISFPPNNGILLRHHVSGSCSSQRNI